MKYQLLSGAVILLSILCGSCMARGVDRGDMFLLVASFSYVFPITMLSYLAERTAKDEIQTPFKEEFK